MIRILSLFAFAMSFAAAHPSAAHEPAKKHRVDYANARETPFGKAADPRKAARTVAIDMADTMRYTPARLTVKRGESVRFVVANRGKVAHEMVLGTLDDLKEHAEHMRRHPGMEHDEPHMLHVAPGRSEEMGWRFTKAGEFFYGCLVPGHYEAGMIGTVTVTP
jgi:uncharacterized cupredoxin-like copper-binding protein